MNLFAVDSSFGSSIIFASYLALGGLILCPFFPNPGSKIGWSDP